MLKPAAFMVMACYIACHITCFIACSTVPEDSLFVVKQLDDSEESKALTEKGVRRYISELEEEEAYEKITEIKEYFIVALRLDPENQRAGDYLKKTESFVSRKVDEKVAKARAFLAKKKRTEKEDFQLAVLVQQAYELEPRNGDVIDLRNGIRELRERLVAQYLEIARLCGKSIGNNDDEEKKTKQYTECMENITMALLIDPGHREAKKEKKVMQDDIAGLFDARVKKAAALYKAGEFQKAEKSLDTLRELDVLLDKRYDGVLKDLYYNINYRWARMLFGEREYAAAEAKIKKAAGIKKTREAAVLMNDIEKQKEKNDFTEGFDDFIAELDGYIKRRDFLRAYDKLAYGLEKAVEPSQRNIIKKRKQTFDEELGKVYEEAVEFYVEENFREAIRLFGIIIDVKENYKQAKSYYHKALSKQRLLDSYEER